MEFDPNERDKYDKILSVIAFICVSLALLAFFLIVQVLPMNWVLP